MGKITDKLSRILYPPGVTRLDPKTATALFLILFSTQLTLTTPFSYLPSMVMAFGYQDRDRGYYAGMIASSLFVGRFFGGYFWGYMTDKYGRRPIILISAILTNFATIAFGFTTNIYWALTTRFLQGLFNGVIVCGRAAFAEICDDTNQAVGVSLVFAAWNSAIVLGPALGGFLASPVKKYPSVFTGVSKMFFTKFAYVLPSLLISIILTLATIMIYFLFPETHNVSKTEEGELLVPSEVSNKENDSVIMKDDPELRRKDMSHEKTDFQYYMLSAEESDDTLYERKDKFQRSKKEKCGCCDYITRTSLFELCSDKYVILVTVMFGISGFCIIGFSELRSLWMATHNALGGLSFQTNDIGVALLVPALVAVILQPIIFARLERKLGGIWTLRITLFFLGLCTALFPFLHLAENNKSLLWTFLILFGIIRMISDISSRSCLALFINNVVYREQAGRANGLAFSVQEIMRVFSPTLLGSLFAWSINDERHKVFFPLDYHLAFFTIALFILIIGILSIMLPRSINLPKQTALTDNDSEEEMSAATKS